MKRLMLKILACVSLLLSISSAADEQAVSLAQKMLPGFTVDAARDAPIANFLEVTVDNRLLYLSKDGKFLFLGDLVDLNKRINLSEQRRAEMTAKLLAGVVAEKMIVIGPETAKRYVTVFTDVDCPYCAKFHLDVPKLNEAGLQVRYLLYPRAGMGSKSYNRAVSVWCAEDQAKAIGVAKAGGSVPAKKCENPVKEHLELGREVGLRGTPLLVLDDGTMIPGYVPPDSLLAQLGLKSTNN